MRFKSVLLFLILSLVSALMYAKEQAQRSGPMLVVGGKEVKDAQKYDKIYKKEYETILKTKIKPKIVYVQPKNKKTPCKIFATVRDGVDETKDKEYKVFWDGECKDGYANGLGRKITITKSKLYHHVGEYERGFARYFEYLDENGTTFGEGEGIRKGEEYEYYGVQTFMKDDKLRFYLIGDKLSRFETNIIVITPLMDYVYYLKKYPNHIYNIFDFSSYPNTKLRTAFTPSKSFKTYTKKANNGYEIAVFKNSMVKQKEYFDGEDLGLVDLPSSYMDFANEIAKDIIDSGKRALKARRKAREVFERYLEKICQKSYKIDFMDMEKYKNICTFSKQREKLKKATLEKLALKNKNRAKIEIKKDENTPWPLKLMDFSGMRTELLKEFR